MILSSSKVLFRKIDMNFYRFTESDNELFEDNAEEYIRRDIEGSDVDTRRRAACDLVREMSAKFEDRIMEIFSAYIQVHLLQHFIF